MHPKIPGVPTYENMRGGKWEISVSSDQVAHSGVGPSAVSVAARQTFGPRIQKIFASSVCDLRLTSEAKRALDLPRQRDLQDNARSYQQGRYHISQKKPDIDLDPSL